MVLPLGGCCCVCNCGKRPQQRNVLSGDILFPFPHADESQLCQSEQAIAGKNGEHHWYLSITYIGFSYGYSLFNVRYNYLLKLKSLFCLFKLRIIDLCKLNSFEDSSKHVCRMMLVLICTLKGKQNKQKTYFLLCTGRQNKATGALSKLPNYFKFQ